MHDLLHPDGRFGDVAFPQDRAIDEELFLAGPAPHDGEVGFAELPPFHGLAEHAGGGLVFRDEDDPTRLSIEAVDEGKVPAADPLVGAEGLKTVEQGRRIPRHRGVHHQMGRLVDDEVVLGLVEHGEIWNVKAQVDDFRINRAPPLCPRISRRAASGP